jgi:DNA repair protein RecO (recombination protein O)
MKLESNGILIGLHPIGERDSIAHIFTRDFGMMHGVLRAAQIAKKNRALVGQVGYVAWNARVDSQLGTFHWESYENLSAPLMNNMRALSAMNSAFALLDSLLPERESYVNMYDATISLLRTMTQEDVIKQYLEWEIKLLRESGYALDLSHCSGCGCTTNLDYLSPRTGRAVCDNCAAPYINKLYKLPITLDTTLHFVSGICAQTGIDVPMIRQYLSRI